MVRRYDIEQSVHLYSLGRAVSARIDKSVKSDDFRKRKTLKPKNLVTQFFSLAFAEA